VGSLGLRLHEPGGFIHSFFVDPAFQNEDVASQLLYEASLICLRYKKPTLGALVPAGYPAHLYEDLGFRPYELRGLHTHYITLLPLLQRQEVTFREYNQR
jgi:GNAT superfamily N-acetyltransferase